MKLPIIVIAGRYNVGKSTLFNRIAGKRIAIVSDIPGTTRDRVSTDASWHNTKFLLLDTGGLENTTKEHLSEEIMEQSERALEQADGIILVTDAKAGPTPDDYEAASLVRRLMKPAVVAVNKADNPTLDISAAEFYHLGLAEVYPISAYHNLGIEDMLDGLFHFIDIQKEDEDDADSIKVAIVGRPNTGKSSIFNFIAGEKRSIVSPIAGTTRDPVDSKFIFETRKITFLDTAGLRRRGKIGQSLEKYSAIRALSSIERADVCILTMSSEEAPTAQDKHIAGYIQAAGRACVAVLNKCDTLKITNEELEDMKNRVRSALNFLPGSPILFTSALNGTGIKDMLHATLEVYGQFTKRISDGDISRCIFTAISENFPPRMRGKQPKIMKVTQSRTAPPTFLMDASSYEYIHFSYLRYLENRVREEFGLTGSPVRFRFKRVN